jgi:hypothetical protein
MKQLAIALALAGAFFATSANAIVTIDDFNTGTPPDGVDQGDGAVNFGASGNTVGHSRTLQITGNNNADLYVDIPSGTLNVGNPPTGSGTTSVVTWDANGAGLGGLDLVEGINDALQLNVTWIDLGSITVTFDIQEIASEGGETATLTINGLKKGNQGFLFTAFDNHENVNFEKVNRIKMTINAATNVDVSMNVVLTRVGVPEPGTLALFGLGLAAASVRRKKAAA